MFQSLHARPTVARLVVLQLSSNPILDPLLAERLLLTLAALGVPKDALPNTFRRAMGVILEMILTVSARSNSVEQKGLSAQVHKAICDTVFDRVSESDRIARGPGRRGRRGRSFEAVPRGRGALRWPAYRDPLHGLARRCSQTASVGEEQGSERPGFQYRSMIYSDSSAVLSRASPLRAR